MNEKPGSDRSCAHTIVYSLATRENMFRCLAQRPPAATRNFEGWHTQFDNLDNLILFSLALLHGEDWIIKHLKNGHEFQQENTNCEYSVVEHRSGVL